MATVFSEVRRLAPAQRSGASSPWLRSLMLRSALLAGSLAAGLTAGAVASSTVLAGVEPKLVVLLRGMALIKAGLALAAMALTWWRLGRPISLGSAVGYVVGVWSLIAASVLIWCLNSIVVGAVIFHLGLFGLLLLSWRDGLSVWRSRVG